MRIGASKFWILLVWSSAVRSDGEKKQERGITPFRWVRNFERATMRIGVSQTSSWAVWQVYVGPDRERAREIVAGGATGFSIESQRPPTP
jgi:hypothetical protein